MIESVTSPRVTRTRADSRSVTSSLILVLICSFLSRFSMLVVGFHLRPEHVATGVLLAVSVRNRDSQRALLAVVRRPALIALSIFLLWSLAVTIAFAPDFHRSLSILLWLASDYVLLACLFANIAHLEVVERLGSGLAVGWALLGILLWTLAESGLATIGVQLDAVYHHWASYVTAFEANIFAVVVALWTLIALHRWRQNTWLTLLLAIAMPWAIVAAQTRAALLALAVGVLILLAAARDRRQRLTAAIVLIGLVVAYAVAALVNVPAVVRSSPPSPWPTTSTPTSGAATPAWTLVSRETPDPTTPTTPSTPTEPAPRPTATGSGAPTKFGQLNLTSGTGEYRRLVWDLAFSDMHGWRLLLGNGVNTFGQRHDDPTHKGVPGYLMTLPLQIVYDSGLVGLTLLLIFFGLMFRQVPSQRRVLAIGVGVVFAVTSLSTSTLWLATIWIMLALMVRPDSSPRVQKSAGDMDSSNLGKHH